MGCLFDLSLQLPNMRTANITDCGRIITHALYNFSVEDFYSVLNANRLSYKGIWRTEVRQQGGI